MIAASAGGIYFYQNYMKEAEHVIANSGANDFKKHQNSIIYDKNGKVLVNLSENANSKYLIYQDIPQNVQNAFIAVEDRAFWKHHGVNVKGIARVLIKYMTSGGKEKHGASTITQQVIRNTFIGKEVKMEVAVGDKVIYSKYSGTEVKMDGTEYIIVKQNDILAVVE